jgi:hypothetical protein
MNDDDEKDDVVIFPGWFMSYLRGEFELHMDEWTADNPFPEWTGKLQGPPEEDLPPRECVFNADELAVPIGLN